MSLHRIRLIFLTLMIFVSVIISISSHAAEGGYADRRIRADIDPLTVKARRYFDTRTPILFSNSKRKYKLNYIQLELNPRLIAQYGRGKGSANKVLPQELDQILKFIASARFNREGVIKEVLSYKTLQKYKRRDIERALSVLAQTKRIRLDYWGYLSRKDRFPEFELKKHKLVYFARWHEAESYYELYPEIQMKSRIIRGLIAELSTNSWWN